MTSYYEKMDLIMEEEERFAFALSLEVVERPKLSMWMVLIPIIFLYFFYQHQRVVDGRKAFVKNYLISRKRALEESLHRVKHGKQTEMDKILRKSTLPEDVRAVFGEFFCLLLEHYTDLLRSNGADMASLVRSVYKSRAHYLVFLNRLNQAEKLLNRAFRGHMGKGVEAVDDVMKRMEVASERLQREAIERFFP